MTARGKYRYMGSVMLAMLMFMGNSASAETEETLELQFSQLLDRYWQPTVTIHGIPTTVFDYAAMKQDAVEPGSLFAQIRTTLESFDPATIKDRNMAKAFWINAYNFGAFQLVIDHYPVDSIRSFKISLLKHPWSQKVLRIGGRDYSLTEIEKDILLAKYGDVRILFAVSCAAVSCPDRTQEAFTGSRVDQKLDDMIRTFFANPYKGLFLDEDAGTLILSWILKKDQTLFAANDGGELGFVLPYLPDQQRKWLQTHNVSIRYFDHDWTLNDLAQAD